MARLKRFKRKKFNRTLIITNTTVKVPLGSRGCIRAYVGKFGRKQITNPNIFAIVESVIKPVDNKANGILAKSEYVKWLRLSKNLNNDDNMTKVFYYSAKLGKTVVKQGDYVVLNGEEPGEPKRIARVTYMFENTLDNTKKFHAHFFCPARDTILGEKGNSKELFIVDYCSDEELESILEKTLVKCGIALQNRQFDSSKEKDYYFVSKIYDYLQSRFIDFPGFINGECFSCNMQKEEELINTPYYENSRIYWINNHYQVGSGVLLEPGQYKDYIDKVNGTEEKCDKLYPEYYRKKLTVRDINSSTPEALTIGCIEEICKQKKDTKIKVRFFYRPEDTSLNKEEQVSKDLNFIYWSTEVVWTSFQYVRGKCYLSHISNIKNLDKWFLSGPLRFYFIEAYDHRKRTFFKLPKSIIKSFGKGDRQNRTPPEYPKLQNKLKCMDLYSGCGGLSEGLVQCGLADVRWAVECDYLASKAFTLNHSDCIMLNMDANKALSYLLKGKSREIRLPEKGEVDIIVAGPPCQGFSQMNRFSNETDAEANNYQVDTFLDFLDHYRPVYFIFENVRNFASFNKNLALKDLLNSVLLMGYQTAYGILQAGNFGVPQARRRFFLLGAAPGKRMPTFPPPTYSFARHSLAITVEQLKYDTGDPDPPGCLPYRSLTVRDAIGDLPEITTGKLKMNYNKKNAISHYARLLRRHCAPDILLDHKCKEMSEKELIRIEHIPKLSEADWRDLPNKAVNLKNNRLKILEYKYLTKYQKQGERPKGVCKCSTSNGKCDPNDKQTNTLIPWYLSHTADRHNQWAGAYGRLDWNDHFKTTTTEANPSLTQGRVLHPDQNRIVSVREWARSQGFPDHYQFVGATVDMYRQIGNAVPPPLAAALGREIIKAINSD